MKTLLDANPIHSLMILGVKSSALASKMEAYGIYKGDFITKEDLLFARSRTLKLRLPNKNSIVIPGKMSHHVHVATATEKEADFHLAEMAEGDAAVITMIEKEDHAIYKFEELGLKEDAEITLRKQLPHMEYRLLVDKKVRMRITEAIAATILGTVDGELRQFFFAKRGKPFLIKDIAQEEAMCNYLQQHGIRQGNEIILETIEFGDHIVIDKEEDVVFFASNGARLSVSKETAAQIMVEELEV